MGQNTEAYPELHEWRLVVQIGVVLSRQQHITEQ